MPAAPEPRTRWMTRSEAARLLRAARRISAPRPAQHCALYPARSVHWEP
jgi:hypothetical protein